MAANTTTRKRASKPKASPPKPPPKSDGLGTGKQREQLARMIIKLREQKVSWPAIKEQTGIKTAIQGRKLMRELQAGDMIGASYDRDEAKTKREAAAAAK